MCLLRNVLFAKLFVKADLKLKKQLRRKIVVGISILPFRNVRTINLYRDPFSDCSDTALLIEFLKVNWRPKEF